MVKQRLRDDPSIRDILRMLKIFGGILGMFSILALIIVAIHYRPIRQYMLMGTAKYGEYLHNKYPTWGQ